MNPTPVTAWIVRVPESESFVGELRNRFDPSVTLGVPAHITVLYPFKPLDRITPTVLQVAADAVRSIAAFSFSLATVQRWPETCCLLPNPVAPFVGLTQAIVRVFPNFPPYQGKHPATVPHLTVADGSREAAEKGEIELQRLMKQVGQIQCHCREIELIGNATGSWKTLHAIALPESAQPESARPGCRQAF